MSSMDNLNNLDCLVTPRKNQAAGEKDSVEIFIKSFYSYQRVGEVSRFILLNYLYKQAG